MFELENAVLNDVLCFLSTSKNVLKRDAIIAQAVGYYKDSDIREAKKIIFTIVKETPIARKSCQSHPNPSVADVEDILNLFDKLDRNKFLLPNFVAGSFSALPPFTGFDYLAGVICSLRDELYAVREELQQLRNCNEKDVKSMEDILTVKEDLRDIKQMLVSKVVIKASKDEEQTLHGMENQRDERTTEAVRVDSFPSSSTCNFAQVTAAGKEKTSNMQSQGEGSQSAQSAQRSSIAARNPSVLRTQESVRPPHSRQRNYTLGSRTNCSKSFGAPRVCNLFVGGCSLETTESDISGHCSELGVVLSECENLATKAGWYKAFRIVADDSKRDDLLSG